MLCEARRTSAVVVAAVSLLLPATCAWAYRPFVSTDAAVADPKEVEVELGYFNLERARRENTFTTPSLVLNYGLFKNWEAVGEFRVEASPDFEVTDPGLFLKAVLKEGLLREKPGGERRDRSRTALTLNPPRRARRQVLKLSGS